MLLLDTDYGELRQRAIAWAEDEAARFLILKGYELPFGVYVQDRADVLLQIPANYNHDGIDMLWLAPRLVRRDGKEVPEQMPYGSPNNVRHAGVEYCRWSRHWTEQYNRWRSGIDDVQTILRRVQWALEHPDANRT